MIPEFSLTLEFIFKRFDFLSFFLSRALNPDLNSVVRRKLSDCLEGEYMLDDYETTFENLLALDIFYVVVKLLFPLFLALGL